MTVAEFCQSKYHSLLVQRLQKIRNFGFTANSQSTKTTKSKIVDRRKIGFSNSANLWNRKSRFLSSARLHDRDAIMIRTFVMLCGSPSQSFGRARPCPHLAVSIGARCAPRRRRAHGRPCCAVSYTTSIGAIAPDLPSCGRVIYSE